jgi:two-component system invasion response regulator UvrY
MIRTLIVDDHAIVRKGLRQILEETTDIVVSDEAETGNEALEKIRKNDYDAIILDISMPDRNGLDILKQIKSEKPDLAVLILSIHPEDQYAVRALRSGASGYLTKESAPEELIEAVRRISGRRKYISSSLAEKLASKLESDSEQPLHEALSDREYEVMLMIAKGSAMKDIAEGLHLSVKTVSTYRSRVLQKMQMKNNAELIHYVISNELT